jgi:hypothetical protein
MGNGKSKKDDWDFPDFEEYGKIVKGKIIINGDIEEGDFQYGKLVKGKITYRSTGYVEEGDFVYDKHGRRTLVNGNGVKIIYKDGLLIFEGKHVHNDWTRCVKEGGFPPVWYIKFDGYFKNGKMVEGKRTSYHGDVKEGIFTYRDDLGTELDPAWPELVTGKITDFDGKVRYKHNGEFVPNPPPMEELCKAFFKNKTCRYGSNCRYSHYHKRRKKLWEEKNIKILFHQTKDSAADVILKTQTMLCGRKGSMGAGIYFATTAEATQHKALSKGRMLKCTVRLGKMKKVQAYTSERDGNMHYHKLKKQGFESVKMDGWNSGTEYVVYNKGQVLYIEEIDM